MKITAKIIVLTVLFLFSATPVCSQTRERTQVPASETWKLEDLYPSDRHWNKAKDELVAQFDEVLKYKGKLSSSASQLLACLDFDSNLSKELVRLRSYAAMNSDQDTRDSKYLAMKQQVAQLITDYLSLASFVEPEIAQMDKSQIDELISEEPGLKIYRMYLHDIQRMKAHKLS
ncbi:MAG: hypothetical protein JSW23_02315, partial [Planctomycetota bacterium]